MTRKPLTDADLPLLMPFPCPICGAKVYLYDVEAWGTDDGEIRHAHFECENEPDLDSNEWEAWLAEHYDMPYVDWLPWGVKALEWLNENYFYGKE